jgi:hypothetical protein
LGKNRNDVHRLDIQIIDTNKESIFFYKNGDIKIEIVHINKVEENTTEFWFCSNKDVKNISVKINVHNFEDNITSDNTTEYEKNQWHLFASYENVEVEQKWKFNFSGTNINENKIFNTTVIYKI